MVQSCPITTGTEIAEKILEIYKKQKKNEDFKNIQRRVYDALNVLSALKFIKKDSGRIIWQGIFVSQDEQGNSSSQTKIS